MAASLRDAAAEAWAAHQAEAHQSDTTRDLRVRAATVRHVTEWLTYTGVTAPADLAETYDPATETVEVDGLRLGRSDVQGAHGLYVRLTEPCGCSHATIHVANLARLGDYLAHPHQCPTPAALMPDPPAPSLPERLADLLVELLAERTAP